MAALGAGKNVITSNKEVVANFGDEFLAEAEKNGVSYRFEAAVGGGIPVISPMISMVLQNKITEIRGILNGTTNYILTKMFREGEDFDSALKDAQAKGYAERNPDADVLGTDACRKISILTSLVCGRLMPTENIHTEGITRIRTEDVRCAESVGLSIKLLGRCLISDEGISIVVAPFMLPATSPLGGVSGVYNAVEIVGEPIGNLMFYGQGAGAGATASAVVGDLMQIMRSGTNIKSPVMKKGAMPRPFDSFRCRSYIAVEGVSLELIESVFGKVQLISDNGEFTFLTGETCEAECEERLDTIIHQNGTVKSRIRLL
jgi:homoserine dehydrogenase